MLLRVKWTARAAQTIRARRLAPWKRVIASSAFLAEPEAPYRMVTRLSGRRLCPVDLMAPLVGPERLHGAPRPRLEICPVQLSAVAVLFAGRVTGEITRADGATSRFEAKGHETLRSLSALPPSGLQAAKLRLLACRSSDEPHTT